MGGSAPRDAGGATRRNARLKAGRTLFSGHCEFATGAVSPEGMPAADRVEVCFAGRSNVGKSSLINALASRKQLARASGSPGRTREINFFELGTSHYLVDLPGYGYAKMPKKLAERARRLLFAYLQGRAPLRRAFVLVDARRGLGPIDRDFLDMLGSAAVAFQIVITKTDCVRADAKETLGLEMGEALRACPTGHPEFLFTSSRTGDGLDELRAEVAEIR